MRILIINVNGQVALRLRGAGRDRARRRHAARALDPGAGAAGGGQEAGAHAAASGRDANGEDELEIIAPYLEDWGRHKLSVAYQVSYRNLKPGHRGPHLRHGRPDPALDLASVLVAVALATRITRPVEELTAGAKDIAEGHFDRRLDIRSTTSCRSWPRPSTT